MMCKASLTSGVKHALLRLGPVRPRTVPSAFMAASPSGSSSPAQGHATAVPGPQIPYHITLSLPGGFVDCQANAGTRPVLHATPPIAVRTGNLPTNDRAARMLELYPRVIRTLLEQSSDGTPVVVFYDKVTDEQRLVAANLAHLLNGILVVDQP
jgi:hypothetical protein